jgi:Protein of unknown function (DUF3306)
MTVIDSQKPLAESEPVLSRWSRLKRDRSAQENVVSKTVESSPTDRINGAMSGGADRDVAASAKPTQLPETSRIDDALPSLDDVALDKDFTPFMQAKIPEALKRQALKALFKDTHFNTMDGLDTYIDDYTKFEPITPEEMAGLSSWKSIMKPLEQVVTPGGYAVDVESEEGKAVLAAREALKREEALSQPEPLPDRADDGAVHTEVTAENSIESPVPATLPRPLPDAAATHGRYGKRVGDFKSDYAPLPIEENAPLISSPARQLADDPR